MRTLEERNKILELHKEGKNQSEISRITGIPRATVRDIIFNKHMKRGGALSEPFSPKDFSEEQKIAYAYILGQYLGDGHINLTKRNVYRLRIFSDLKYPNIIKEIKSKLEIILPQNKSMSNITIWNDKPSCDTVTIYSKKIKDMFPQHGEGIKADRKIELLEWQESIIKSYPKEFIRGLIHSDGCRFIPKASGKVNYQFTNTSTDIITLYCKTLDMLNIKYRIAKKPINGKAKRQAYDISTSRKESVNILESFVGPKS